MPSSASSEPLDYSSSWMPLLRHGSVVHPLRRTAAVGAKTTAVGRGRRNLLVAQRHGSLATDPARVSSTHSPIQYAIDSECSTETPQQVRRLAN